MTHRRIRPVVVVALVMLIGASLVAQRGGFRGQYTGNPPYDGRFQFVRMSYPWFQRGGAAWAHDYPDGEENFLKIMQAVTNAPMHVSDSSIMNFNDPEMFKNPVIYLCEPGYWQASDEDVKHLHDFFVKGGFMIADDFPSWAWANFELVISRVFPELQWQDMEIKHPIFHSFFEIDTLNLPIAYGNLGGYPIFRGLFEGNDKNKRLLIIANYQNDISEYWEHSSTGWKPVAENNEAFKFGVNEFLYGITH
jgi:uncharacterized protein DUF4159